MASLLPTYPPQTLATLIYALSVRLNFSVFWSHAELRALVIESLITFQAHARWWRKRCVFSTHLDSAGNSQFFYDLTQELPAELGFNATDAGILSFLEFALLEPQSGVPANPTWQGSDQFPQDAYTDAIRKRRDRFLLDTAAVVEHHHATGVVAESARVTLPNSIIDVRRVDWVERIPT